MKIANWIYYFHVWICAVIDLIVLCYWCGIYHEYDPEKHKGYRGPKYSVSNPKIRPSASNLPPSAFVSLTEYSFGQGALSRYWQLIMANLFCMVVYGGAGAAMFLFFKKSKGKINEKQLQTIVIGLCFLGILGRVYWFYTESRQFLVSVKTLTRREEEIYTYHRTDAPILQFRNEAQIQKNYKQVLEDAKDKFVDLGYFDEVCYRNEVQLDFSNKMEYARNAESENRAGARARAVARASARSRNPSKTEGIEDKSNAGGETELLKPSDKNRV